MLKQRESPDATFAMYSYLEYYKKVMAVKMTHLTPRDAEDSYKTGLGYKGDNVSQISGQNTAGDEEREKLSLRTLRYYSLLIRDPSPKVKREQVKILEGSPRRKD